MNFTLPLRLPSMANQRLHWAVKAKVIKAQRMALALAWRNAMRRGAVWTLPATIRLTRAGPRALDDDNLASAFKAIRDQIAEEMGIDDADFQVSWKYSQEKGPYGVRVEVVPL